MCTALVDITPGRPLLLVGVRDELASRPWLPPAAHWPGRPALIGGQDLLAGGTWLAVSPGERRVGCVLNGRGQLAPAATRGSRGELPLLAAAGEQLDAAGLGNLDPFHLITAEPGRATVRSWDGTTLTERKLEPGLHFAVNSGFASDLMPDELLRHAERADSRQAVNGRAHELARIAHFLPKFYAASRPAPSAGQPIAAAWGDWFALVNGDGLDPGDERALIIRRDLGDGRIWGTSSISLVALSPDGVRYDFTASPGDPAAWYPVP